MVAVCTRVVPLTEGIKTFSFSVSVQDELWTFAASNQLHRAFRYTQWRLKKSKCGANSELWPVGCLAVEFKSSLSSENRWHRVSCLLLFLLRPSIPMRKLIQILCGCNKGCLLLVVHNFVASFNVPSCLFPEWRVRWCFSWSFVKP